MSTLKNTGRLAALVALAAAWSAPVPAQCPPGHEQGTQVFTDTFGPEIGDWGTITTPETMMVPKFVPPVNATLIRAEFTLCGRVTGTANYQNNDDDPCTLSFTVTAQVQAEPADAASPLTSLTLDLEAEHFGINLAPGQNGSSNFDSGIECAPGTPLVFTSGPDLDWFIASPGDEDVVIEHVGHTFSQHTGCGVIDFTSDIFTDLFIRVTYTYCIPPDTTTTEGCACSGPSPHYRRPGSLLLYPEFDNRAGDVTILTLTNTDCGVNSPDVTVEIVYIEKDGCSEFNRTITLTACDTLTLLTNVHNPNHQQGYAYAFAKNAQGTPIVWNHLIGNLLVVSGIEAFDYSVNPVVFGGIGSASGIPQPDGSTTNLDGDTIRDLDGAEYEPAPDVITIPRFLGQDYPGPKGGGGPIHSQVILIALSGGQQFTETAIDCLLYNDNEEDFSFTHTFYCWEKPFLLDIAPAASNVFLKTTDHDPDEIVGAPQREAGWICCDGLVASSSQESIMDPAFYMLLVERIGTYAAADLPFECGVQYNGALLPRNLLGDGDPVPMNGDNQ